jgi:hypothetical protein
MPSGWRLMIDIELARQSAQLMAARAAAWQRFIRVVHGGPRNVAETDICAHDLDLLRQCRSCGQHVSESD